MLKDNYIIFTETLGKLKKKCSMVSKCCKIRRLMKITQNMQKSSMAVVKLNVLGKEIEAKLLQSSMEDMYIFRDIKNRGKK